ncbi:MAG: hypothetical protein ACOCXA_01370, partial [Planctomycetota bacterium]
MEFFLNDVCISLFGSANPDYDPETATTLHGIAVDFNGDGMAESTVTGWWDGRQTVWSWWWNGLGPSEGLDTDLDDPAHNDAVPAWMKTGAWYRIQPAAAVGDRILRFNGVEWESVDPGLPGGADFLEVNDLWLTPATQWPSGSRLPGIASTAPIRPFSHTARLFIGHSESFTIFLRGQLFDLKEWRPLVDRSREVVWHRDPDGDGAFDDQYIEMEQPFGINVIWD